MIDSIEEKFKDAMRGEGIAPPDEIVADGLVHRFDAVHKKRGNKRAWYVLHADGIPTGQFGDWGDGCATHTWCARDRRTLSNAEKATFNARLDFAVKARAESKLAAQAAAALLATERWNRATPAPADHPYLVRKGIQPHGLRVEGTSLLVPLTDTSGKPWSLQTIDAHGGKMVMAEGRIRGNFYALGDLAGCDDLLFAEGFSTAATIREQTNKPVIVAINAGNIKPVAEALRAMYPAKKFTVCADDDWKATDNKGRSINPGVKKATEAAQAVGAWLAVPDFGAVERGEKDTDFNDLVRLRGGPALHDALACAKYLGPTVARPEAVAAEAQPEAVAAVVAAEPEAQPEAAVVAVPEAVPEAVVAAPEAVVAAPWVNQPGTSDTEADDEPPVRTSPFPDRDNRPQFVVYDDWQKDEGTGRKYQPGVWHCYVKPETTKTPAVDVDEWVCGPLHVDAITRDDQANNYGRLLRFKNQSGDWREWSMPMEMLAGDGTELRAALLSMGLAMDTLGDARRSFIKYLQKQHPKRHVRCVQQVGWCDGHFVHPSKVIGTDPGGIIFQSGGHRGHDEYTERGGLTSWRDSVASKAANNPLLTMALSAAFTGPLMRPCHTESGGIHFHGPSSSGKSTLLDAAVSVWGGHDQRRSWRATSNGMEGAAAMFNDGMLALDEIGECDPKEVGAIVYSIGNGQGKQRADRTGAARGVTRWTTFLLSNGEHTLETVLANGGQTIKAGQSVRLLDVVVNRPHGAWDDLHGASSAATFSDDLKTASKQFYGTAGRAFLERLTRDNRKFPELFEFAKKLPEFNTDGAGGQVSRAAARFALIGLAGELATEYEVTGWPEGTALAAAAAVFAEWRRTRESGDSNSESRQILQQLAGYIDRFGDSKFSSAKLLYDTGRPVLDRAGWWDDTEDTGRIYMFTTSGLKDALRGIDIKRALDVLETAKALAFKKSADGSRTKPCRVAGRDGLVRLTGIIYANLTEVAHVA